MSRPPPVLLQSLLFVLLHWLCLHSAVAQSGGWCPTGVQPLPNLTAILSSTAYQYYGAADDECSSFYFSAIDTSPNATSPSVLLRADETLNVTLVNQQPLPASLLAAGLRYITDMEYFNLRLYAPITSSLPLSASPSSYSSRHVTRVAAQSAPSVSSGIAVLSTANLTILHWYPLSQPVALQYVVIDYGDSTLYASASLSVSALLHFSISTAGLLKPLPDVQLASRPPFTAIRGSALYYPGGLWFYVTWVAAQSEQSAVAGFGVAGSVLQYDVKAAAWSSVLNVSTALPVTSMADFWSTSLPDFGSMHLVDGSTLYNYDSC